MIRGFYWLIPETLAGCARPGSQSSGSDDHDEEALRKDLGWLSSAGFDAILSLTETPLPDDALTRHGFEVMHIPVTDMTAPNPTQFVRALNFIDRQQAMGKAIVVHCKEGQGRTGTILAAYLIRSGASAQEAVSRIRCICPGAIGSHDQEAALRAFESRRDWIV